MTEDEAKRIADAMDWNKAPANGVWMNGAGECPVRYTHTNGQALELTAVGAWEVLTDRNMNLERVPASTAAGKPIWMAGKDSIWVSHESPEKAVALAFLAALPECMETR